MVSETDIGGSIVALITPFRENGKIDEEGLRSLVDFQVENGTDAILACGTTGESATMNGDERTEVIRIVAEQANKRVLVIAGTGTNATAGAVDLTKRAEEVGADAALIVTPYYNKPTQGGLVEHFTTVANSTSLPIILYNVPGRTACNIEAKTTLQLAEVENVVAVKEASGNMGQIMEILRKMPDGFRLLSGDDSLTHSMMGLGASGVISVANNCVPQIVADFVHAMRDGNYQKGRELHFRLLPLFNGIFAETNPIPIKEACRIMGLPSGSYRLPLVAPKKGTTELLEGILSELGVR